MKPLFSFVEVHKRFAGIEAVVDATLELHAGEIAAVVGPNGSGKSTLLKIGCGVLAPDAGVLLLGDRDITRSWAHSRARRTPSLAYILQHRRIIPGRSPAANVLIGQWARHPASLWSALLPFTDQRRAFSSQMWRADVEVRAALGRELPPTADQLSVGQQRLLEILRLQGAAPTIAILDEPTAGLWSTDLLVSIMRTIASNGGAVLLAEHNLSFVRHNANRFLSMDRGRLLEVDSISEPTSAPVSSRGVSEGKLLQVEGLRVRIDGRQVASLVSFSIGHGSRLALIGRNGSGKTSALLGLCGLREGKSRSLAWKGMRAASLRAWLGRSGGVGIVLQNHRLFNALTAQEHFGLVHGESMQSLPNNLLSFIGNIPLGVPIWTLSGGQRQRIAIAQVILRKPRLLILDEPSAGLDPDGIRELHRILDDLTRGGTAIIIAEHNASLLQGFPFRIEFRDGVAYR